MPSFISRGSLEEFRKRTDRSIHKSASFQSINCLSSGLETEELQALGIALQNRGRGSSFKRFGAVESLRVPLTIACEFGTAILTSKNLIRQHFVFLIVQPKARKVSFLNVCYRGGALILSRPNSWSRKRRLLPAAWAWKEEGEWPGV